MILVILCLGIIVGGMTGWCICCVCLTSEINKSKIKNKNKRVDYSSIGAFDGLITYTKKERAHIGRWQNSKERVVNI